jgi:hypothetical protein
MPHHGQFPSGDLHPRSIDLTEREYEVSQMDLGTLRILPRTIIRDNRSRLKIKAYCVACGETRILHVDNVRAGKTKSCTCQRNRKYHDPRAETLGQRYDAMVQRCERDTHVSSHNYKGRGIRVEFQSREHFVRWALEKFPDTDFKGLDFDRIDNDGHYSPHNLRLANRSANLRNRRNKSDI